MLGIASLLGSLIFLITVICAFLITQLPHKMWIKFVLIPVVLTLAVTSFLLIPHLMGYPFPGVPQGRFQVQEVRMKAEAGHSQIEFWALQNGHSRLYAIPYDGDMMNTLRNALEAGRSGKGMTVLEFKKGKKGGNSTGETYAYTLEGSFNPLNKAMPPKDDKADPPMPAMGLPAGPPMLGAPNPLVDPRPHQ